MMKKYCGLILLILIILTLSACNTISLKNEQFKNDIPTPTVLVMPLDIELTELTVGGNQELKADWTENAKRHIKQALSEILNENTRVKIKFAEFNDFAARDDEQHQVDQLIKLNQLIGRTLMRYAIAPAFMPPTKRDEFQWSLGDVALLKEKYQADYAVFVYIRDSYASSGRHVLVITGALLGVGIQGGAQVGFASLVDLSSGDFIWFNRLVRQSGDLRTAEPAKQTMMQILTDIPLL